MKRNQKPKMVKDKKKEVRGRFKILKERRKKRRKKEKR